MKKIAAILILGVGVAIGAFAATSGNLTLTGTVAQNLSITVTPAAVASALDLTTAQNNLAVATITEVSNSHLGYTVTVSSANAVSASSSTPDFTSATSPDTLAYSLTYGGTPVAFTSGIATVTTATAKTPAGGVSNTLGLTYDGSTANLSAGTYSDTLTFTITAN